MTNQNELAPQPAVMTATVQITRAKTGKVEEYQLTFTPVAEPPAEPEKQEND